ncbi:hypothetical protein [Methylobacterium tarhaniae]|uniref:hypothetical protein n=1 Tax=Methylobacterium tarhaniae TaxID=1187852 RepID=UPI003D0884C5
MPMGRSCFDFTAFLKGKRKASLWIFIYYLCILQVYADESPKLILGFNQVNMAWRTPDEQSSIVRDLRSAGVTTVRMTLHQPFRSSLEAIKLASESGLKVILSISLNAASYYSPDVTLRPGGRVESSYPLSSIDVLKFERHFLDVWRYITNNNVKIYAVEVGNEINWAFNGDLAADTHGGGRVYRSIVDLPNDGKFLRGLQRYIEIVKNVKKIRDSSGGLNATTPILTAGLARITPEFSAQVKADAVDPGLTYSLLADLGISQFADAPAMHLYPPSNVSPEVRSLSIDSTLRDCALSGILKPCWITEWGFSNTDRKCPLDDTARTKLVVEILDQFLHKTRQGMLSAAIYFDWSGSSSRSVWRCGTITGSGQAIVRAASGEATDGGARRVDE